MAGRGPTARCASAPGRKIATSAPPSGPWPAVAYPLWAWAIVEVLRGKLQATLGERALRSFDGYRGAPIKITNYLPWGIAATLLCCLIGGIVTIVYASQAKAGWESDRFRLMVYSRASHTSKELTPDVLLMDVTMPELNGLKATERLHEDCPGVRVVALTRHSERGYMQQLLQAGAAG